MDSEKKRRSRGGTGSAIALILLLFYLGGYVLFGTRYDRPPITIRAFASEIAWAYWPLGKIEAIVRGSTVEFQYRSELPGRRGEPHVIQFRP